MANSIFLSWIVVFVGASYYKEAYGLSQCLHNINVWQGTFNSSGYATSYPPNMDCYWLLTVPEGNVIQIQFTDFAVEYSPNCTKDYVEVYDGSKISKTSLMTSRLCGQSLHQSVFTSRDNVMLVRMRTDGIGSSRGYNASHQGLCRVNITSSQGTINFPLHPSQGPMACNWKIDRGPGYFTAVTVKHFTISNHTNCPKNHIKIYDVHQNNSVVLTVCRDVVSPTTITNKGPVRVSMVLGDHLVNASAHITFNTSDVNECEINKHDCHPNTTVCLNTQGSFRCPCKSGYTGTHNKCSDINECLLPLHNCHNKAECINTNGSFTCQCLGGFRGNGVDCTDVNECLEKSHNCRLGAICINKEGSYTCPCRDGFQYDRKTAQCISDILTAPPPASSNRSLTWVEITSIVIAIVIVITITCAAVFYVYKKRAWLGSRNSFTSEGDEVTCNYANQVVSRDYEFQDLSFYDTSHKRYPAYGNHFVMEGQRYYHDNNGYQYDSRFDQVEAVEV